MKCPFCKEDDDKVVDSRSAEDGSVVRRRRQCLRCGRRYTSYERIEEIPLRIIKKDGSRVPFDRNKIMNGVLKACEKTSVAVGELERVVQEIEEEINEHGYNEVESRHVGEMVMSRLRELNHIAYVRFASVYREFRDISQFYDELQPLKEEQKPAEEADEKEDARDEAASS